MYYKRTTDISQKIESWICTSKKSHFAVNKLFGWPKLYIPRSLNDAIYGSTMVLLALVLVVYTIRKLMLLDRLTVGLQKLQYTVCTGKVHVLRFQDQLRQASHMVLHDGESEYRRTSAKRVKFWASTSSWHHEECVEQSAVHFIRTWCRRFTMMTSWRMCGTIGCSFYFREYDRLCVPAYVHFV